MRREEGGPTNPAPPRSLPPAHACCTRTHYHASVRTHTHTHTHTHTFYKQNTHTPRTLCLSLFSPLNPL